MITSGKWLRESAQLSRVASAVPRWLEGVPIYQRRSRGPDCLGPAAEFWRCFHSLPTITKREIRNGFPRNFLPDGVELEQLLETEKVELERTSGTSDIPTPLLLARGWWQRQEQATLRLNPWIDRNLPPDARRVSIISPTCNSEIDYAGVPTCSERILGQNLFVNVSRHPFVWSDAALERMLSETIDWKPTFLDVDPVYGALFALYCERQGVRLPSLRFVVTSYEFASTVHRRIMARALGVPVYDLYGSTETGHLMMEIERGQMVPNLETAYLEVTAPDPEGIGDLIVTTLDNEFMPLIRYDIGDLVCRRGDSYESHYELYGRRQDALISTRGNRVTVGQIDRCFREVKGIVHYHLRQPAHNNYVLYFVPEARGVSTAESQLLTQQLQQLLGTTDGLTLKPVTYLPCEASGKFRLSLNESRT